MVEIWATEGGVTKKLVFSGDLGNIDQPIIRNPEFLDEADYVVMESTYGDRNHEPPESYTESLAQLIDDTFARGGNVIIPSFAVGRTQELLYFLREIKHQGLVKSFPSFQVCVDSPLAAEATRIYSGDLRGYLDEEAITVLQGGENLFTFPGLTLVQSTDESKALNMDKSSKVIISASGMCDAGRIRHHLKHNLWRQECSVVFVGYQAEGSLGRRLLEGAKSVKLFGEEIAVNARIVNFQGLSSHADRDHLLAWIQHFSPAPQQVFVVHGDSEVTDLFARDLNELGIAAHAPSTRRSTTCPPTACLPRAWCWSPGRCPAAQRQALPPLSGFRMCPASWRPSSAAAAAVPTRIWPVWPIRSARSWKPGKPDPALHHQPTTERMSQCLWKSTARS